MDAVEVPEEFDAARLVALLAPWQLRAIRVGGELTVHGDRSRTWLIHDGGRKFAAKLTFDGPRYVEPGLRIATAVDAAGILTGPPVRTASGELCSVVPRVGGRPWTIALLNWVPGDPIDPSEAGMQRPRSTWWLTLSAGGGCRAGCFTGIRRRRSCATRPPAAWRSSTGAPPAGAHCCSIC